MVRLAALATVVVVAAAVQHGNAEAGSLRSMLNERLQGKLEVIANKGRCKPEESRATEDRECEDPLNKADEACQCRVRCNCWGDPHCSPFFTECPASTMHKPGRYTLWALDRANIKIETDVKAMKGTPYTMTTVVNGEVVFDADKDCKTDGSNSKTGLFIVSADDGKSDVEVEYTAYCRKKHGVMHLSIVVDVRDTVCAVPNYNAETFWQDSTLFFKDDYGVCTNPGGYGFVPPVPEDKVIYNCNRPMDQPINGKKACRAECAAYGDPHIYDFESKMGTTKKDFTIPKKPVRNDRIMYSFFNEFATELILDSCDFIAGVRLYLRKASSNQVCGQTAAETVSPADYEVLTYLAADKCTEEKDFDPKTRARYVVPTDGDPNFDPVAEGFPLGRYVDVDGTVINAPPTVSGVSSCSGGSKVNGIMEMGGVQLTLKCHRTVDKVPYWNVCVRRKEVVKTEFDPKAKSFRDLQPLNDDFATIEKDGKTFGWCATGNFIKKNGKRTEDFQFRRVGQYHVFQFFDA